MVQVFVGREAESRLLLDSASKNRSCLVLGEAGVGKSALLEFVAELIGQERPLVLVSRVSPFGLFLKELFAGLFELELLPDWGERVEEAFKAWKKQHATNDDKARALVFVLEANPDVVLVIDDCSGITPGNRPWLELMVQTITVMAALEPIALKKRGSKRFWKRFDEVKLERLSKDESALLLEGLVSKYEVKADDLGKYKRKVLDLAQGSPFELTRLVKYHSAEALVKTQDLNAYSQSFVERDEKGIALAPVLLIVGSFVIASRYIARAQGDLDLYVLSGIGIGIMLVFGPFLRSSLKPRSS